MMMCIFDLETSQPLCMLNNFTALRLFVIVIYEENILYKTSLNKLYFMKTSKLIYKAIFLGKRGIYTDSKGLKIAYVSGTASTDSNSTWTYSEKDVSDLCEVSLKGNASFRGVDILLVSQWPSDIISDTSKEVIKKYNNFLNSQGTIFLPFLHYFVLFKF